MARSRIEIVGDSPEHQSDGALAVRAGTGDREAFEELYRRHSRTAIRVAYRVTGNIHDASDAVSDAFARVMQALPEGRLAEPSRFRSYLLTATRHAAVDVLRRAGRAVPSDTDNEPAQTTAGPSEMLMDRADNALVAAAFRALPERWRSVLWLTEVEGIPAREAAGMLGVSANGVAQLAVRARAGLRERYLQAHLPVVEGECREAVSRLGAYVGGALAPRDVSRVDQHLASCRDCQGREGELREIGTTLRRGVAAAPVAGGLGLGRWLWDAAARAWRALASLGSSGAEASMAKVAPVGAAAAAVLVASIASIGVVDKPSNPTVPGPAAVAPKADVARPESVVGSSSSEAALAPAAPAPVRQSRPAANSVVTWRPPASTTASTTTSTTVAPSQHVEDDDELAPPRATTTTTTAPPPAVEGDEEPDVVDEVIEVVEGVTPTTLPLPVPLPLPIEVPDVPGAVEEITELLPLDIETVVFQALLGAMDEATYSLWFAVPDEPLPSPDAPGLPV